MSNILGNRIKMLRKEKNLTQDELAQFLGLKGKSSIANYENGLNAPSDEIKIKMCEIFNCSMDYLMGLDATTEPNKKIDKNIECMGQRTEKGAIVFVYGTIPAGTPIECIEDIIDTEEIPASMLKGGKEYFGLKVKGNSMYPEYLDGDTLILLRQDNCESGDDCVVMVNGEEGTFKRVFKSENGIILQPLNNAYEPLSFSNKEIEELPVRILGIVEEIRRKRRRKR